MMEFLELAKQRHSVRKFSPRPVERHKIAQIIEAARVAPTAANRQPVRIVVAETKEQRAKLSGAADTYGAPLVFVACANETQAWHRPLDGKGTSDIDASIITDHMMMEATDLGLGSVWICWFDPAKVREAFSLPADLEPVNILAVGYSDQSPANPNRHAEQRISADELVIALPLS